MSEELISSIIGIAISIKISKFKLSLRFVGKVIFSAFAFLASKITAYWQIDLSFLFNAIFSRKFLKII